MHIKSRPIALVMFCLSLVCPAQGLLAGDLQKFLAKRQEYFADHALIAIYPPTTEGAGALLMPSGEVSQCVTGYKLDAHESNLLSGSVLLNTDIAAGADATIKKVLDVAARSRVSFGSELKISFSKVTFKEVGSNEVKEFLEGKKGEGCRRKIREAMMDALNDRYSGLPVVMRQVWYGVENTSLEAYRELQNSIEAESKKAVKQVDVSADVNIERKGSGSLAIISKMPLAIAWRPAFISAEDYIELSKEVKRGLFIDFYNAVQEYFFNKAPIEEIKKRLIDKYPAIVFERKFAVQRMLVGTPIKLDERDEGHVAYLKAKASILAASYIFENQ